MCQGNEKLGDFRVKNVQKKEAFNLGHFCLLFSVSKLCYSIQSTHIRIIVVAVMTQTIL